jgi:hypothetical protein
MNEKSSAARGLWVIPSDILTRASAEVLAEQLQSLFGCDVWLFLDRTALAFSPKGVFLDRGRAIDYPSYLKITKPLFEFVGRLSGKLQNLRLEIPDDRFCVQVLLPEEELEMRCCRYIKCHLETTEPLSFLAYASYKLSHTSRKKIRAYIEGALQKYNTRVLYGDRLELGNICIADYYRASDKFYFVEDGLEIRCSMHRPVVWPWIEMYLDVRKNLPIKERLSLEFFNTDNPFARLGETSH